MSRAAVIAATVLVIVLAGCGGGGSKGKSSLVKSNTSLAATLPLYPHAKLTHQNSTGYTAGSAKIAGYQTHYTYSLPATATVSNVEAYYLKNMDSAGWKQVASLTGPVINYRKGNAFVSISLTEVGSHQLQVVADNDFFSHVKK
jgi:hypothetical protein